MNQVHHECYTVRHHEAGRSGKLSLTGWFDYQQEAAANHASMLGVGLEFLHRHNMLWVLSRIKLEILRYPDIGEKVTVKTYPNGFRRLFAARQFRILDAGGADLGHGSSYWLLLSRDKMRPMKSEDLPVPIPDNSGLPDYFALDAKIVSQDIVPEMDVPVRYSMEDVNQHMNNARYAGVIEDFAAMKLAADPVFRTVEINFLTAVKSPDTLSSGGFLAPDGNLFVEGKNSAGDVSFTSCSQLRQS